MRHLRIRESGRAFLLITILLTIVGTPALLASKSPRYGYEYGGDRLKYLAEEIEDAAERAEDAAHDRHHRGRHNKALRSSLDDLEDCAEDYRSAVRRDRGLDRSVDDFRGLVRAYHEADAVARRYRNRGVDEELYRVGRLLEEANAVYSRAFNTYRRGDYRDRGRYDRRDDRRTHRDDWRYRGRGRGGATIVLPRIRIDLPF